ncbi:Nuclear fragile X mental retardation-interacting protein 1 (NUFIP1) [Ceratocystis platani]|uniref:Nuclear fragile X mental retardation-interacting protein 1 (NUFIP1) n=1 Tax=Ceratocystis fimbriata f. sp. platani TaxID=88771 RepID=A0A0F8BWQ9_CERFI|nr:Nuclear fragile X mental retardation-interacting protein 1 (NUFIP1) [Ceratocystis platani]
MDLIPQVAVALVLVGAAEAVAHTIVNLTLLKDTLILLPHMDVSLVPLHTINTPATGLSNSNSSISLLLFTLNSPPLPLRTMLCLQLLVVLRTTIHMASLRIPPSQCMGSKTTLTNSPTLPTMASSRRPNGIQALLTRFRLRTAVVDVVAEEATMIVAAIATATATTIQAIATLLISSSLWQADMASPPLTQGDLEHPPIPTLLPRLFPFLTITINKNNNSNNNSNSNNANSSQKPDLVAAGKKKKRKTNTLGLTPGDESASDNDEGEEKYLTELMGLETMQITDIPAYISDRRKNYPTKQRIEEKKANEEAQKKAQQDREEALRLEKQADKLRRQLRKVESSIKRKREQQDEGDEMRQSEDESDDDLDEEAAKQKLAAEERKADVTKHCKYFSTGGNCGKKSKCRFVHDPAVRDAALKEKQANNGQMTIRQRLILNDKEQEDLSILESIDYLRQKGIMARASIILTKPPVPVADGESPEIAAVTAESESTATTIGAAEGNIGAAGDADSIADVGVDVEDEVKKGLEGSLAQGETKPESPPAATSSSSDTAATTTTNSAPPSVSSLPQKPPLSSVPAGKPHTKRSGGWPNYTKSEDLP